MKKRTLHIHRSQVVDVSGKDDLGNSYFGEASALGIKPGEWPHEVQITSTAMKTQVTFYHKADHYSEPIGNLPGELLRADYESAYGLLRLSICND